MANLREHRAAVLESVLGATPREFESRILRHADLRRDAQIMLARRVASQVPVSFPVSVDAPSICVISGKPPGGHAVITRVVPGQGHRRGSCVEPRTPRRRASPTSLDHMYGRHVVDFLFGYSARKAVVVLVRRPKQLARVRRPRRWPARPGRAGQQVGRLDVDEAAGERGSRAARPGVSWRTRCPG